jgi:hypothetical protein
LTKQKKSGLENKTICANSIKTKWKLSWNQQNFDMLGFKDHVDLSKMLEINYKSKIAKTERISKIWKGRINTSIGRIVGIKTIVLSLFNHLFVSLPNPPNFIYSTNKNFIF